MSEAEEEEEGVDDARVDVRALRADNARLRSEVAALRVNLAAESRQRALLERRTPLPADDAALPVDALWRELERRRALATALALKDATIVALQTGAQCAPCATVCFLVMRMRMLCVCVFSSVFT